MASSRRLIDVGMGSEPENAVLAARKHHYRAVFGPAPQLGLAWGMEEHDVRTKGGPWDFDWLPEGKWKPEHSDPAFGHVLVNGAPIWQVMYASLAGRAGLGGYLPWPRSEHGGEVGEVTLWEASFAHLLSELGGTTRGVRLRRGTWGYGHRRGPAPSLDG